MIEVVSEAEVTLRQREFVRQWSNIYFKPVGATENLEEAEVHWRIFVSDSEQLAGHVAVTGLKVEIDGTAQTVGAIGGLLTSRRQMGRGFGSALMATAESLVFEKLQLSTAILFCLPELISFYQRRGWCRVETPVALVQPSGETAVWQEVVMVLPAAETSWTGTSIKVL